MIDKNLFLLVVHETLYNHPEWLSETQLAIQQSLESRIAKETSDKTDLAYAMSIYVSSSPKVTEKNWNLVVKGIAVLQSVFEGSEFGKKLNELLEKHKEK